MDDPIALRAQAEAELENVRRTERCSRPPTSHPSDMSDSEKLNEILLRMRDTDTRIGSLERESTQTRKWLDEIILDIVPRVEKLEAQVEYLAARVRVADAPCDDCPRKAAAG